MRKTVVVALLAAGALLVAVLLLVAGVLLLVLYPSLTHVERSELIGTYLGSYDVFPKITAYRRKGIYKGGTHLLELKSDGTYTYLYEPADGNAVKTAGTWQFGYMLGEARVEINSFVLAPSKTHNVRPGTWSFSVCRTGSGRIWIVVNDDECFYLVNQRRATRKPDRTEGAAEDPY